MIIYMNTKIEQYIIIIASTLHETRQNRCWCKNAPNIQAELMGLMIKSMFNDTLNKPWYTGVRALYSCIKIGDNTLPWGHVNIQIPEISIGVLTKISSFQLEWVGFKNTLICLSGIWLYIRPFHWNAFSWFRFEQSALEFLMGIETNVKKYTLSIMYSLP